MSKSTEMCRSGWVQRRMSHSVLLEWKDQVGVWGGSQAPGRLTYHVDECALYPPGHVRKSQA